MKSTSKHTSEAADLMSKAAESGNSLEQTIFYSNQAIFVMLLAVVAELQNLREAIESKS